jgi:hypothetical protein
VERLRSRNVGLKDFWISRDPSFFLLEGALAGGLGPTG